MSSKCCITALSPSGITSVIFLPPAVVTFCHTRCYGLATKVSSYLAHDDKEKRTHLFPSRNVVNIKVQHNTTLAVCAGPFVPRDTGDAAVRRRLAGDFKQGDLAGVEGAAFSVGGARECPVEDLGVEFGG